MSDQSNQASRTLNPALKTFGAMMLVVSAVSPASSVFVIMPMAIAQAGSGSVLSFVLAAILALFMAFVYAELSSAYPTTGGEYTMTGRTMNRFWGFLMLVLIVLNLILVISVMALGMSTYLAVLGLKLNVQWTAVLVVAAAAGVSVLHVKLNAFVTGLFLSIEIFALVLLCVLGFFHVERPLMDLLTVPQVISATTNGLAPASYGLILGAMSVALFSYSGYGSAAYFGEETHDAKRSMGRVIMLALAISVVTQFVPLVAVLMGSPNLIDLINAPQKIDYFLEARAGHTFTVIISLAVASAIFNAVIALVLQAGRLLYSTGRDRTWFEPLNSALATIHPKFNSPWIATLIASVIGAAACFTEMRTLLLLSGTALLFTYTLLCAAVIVGRRNGSTDNGDYRMPFFPFPAILCLIGLGYVFYQNAIDKDFGLPSLIVTGEILVAAALYFLFFLSHRKDWHFHAPHDQESVEHVV
jgi:amino acid transporter